MIICVAEASVAASLLYKERLVEIKYGEWLLYKSFKKRV